MSSEQEEEALNALLHQKHIEIDFYNKHSNDLWMKGRPVEEPLPEDPQSPFQFARMLFSQLGLTAWDKRGQVQLLKKCDKLLRELKNLDSQVSYKFCLHLNFQSVSVIFHSLEMPRDS